MNFYTDNREWQIVGRTARRNTARYPCCKEKYPDITFTLAVQRVSTTYKAVIICPCLGKLLFTLELQHA